ncbi:MAG TPA: hypothetical protein VMZ91_02765 [Candidatus Paceibacterota bacterium]|nr:hypothetical protein [Candidatus Paceibacterota bacterium]
MQNKKPEILDALNKACKGEENYETCFASLKKIFEYISEHEVEVRNHRHEIEVRNHRVVSIKKIIDGKWKESE